MKVILITISIILYNNIIIAQKHINLFDENLGISNNFSSTNFNNRPIEWNRGCNNEKMLEIVNFNLNKLFTFFENDSLNCKKYEYRYGIAEEIESINLNDFLHSYQTNSSLLSGIYSFTEDDVMFTTNILQNKLTSIYQTDKYTNIKKKTIEIKYTPTLITVTNYNPNLSNSIEWIKKLHINASGKLYKSEFYTVNEVPKLRRVITFEYNDKNLIRMKESIFNHLENKMINSGLIDFF